MSKRTAIIDIGSNSARLVIYERTSRYGFHLICEQKSKVRIGEGAYAKDGYLQSVGINRAYLALNSFIQTTKKYSVNKILCVATSALRDAPNGREFVAWIREHLKLSIKIIDGDKEALLGAIAVNNLLPIKSGITIDIGGGSSDMTLILENNIIETCSLNIGTVRIKELFMDKGLSITEAQNYIQAELEPLPKSFRHNIAIGIGGTARALSKAIMKNSSYPFDKIHAFGYTVADEMDFLNRVARSSKENIHKYNIKEERVDTIREGALILSEILHYIGAKEVITSGVGVREGVYLQDLLRNSNQKFPYGFDPSTRCILDRFDNLTNKSSTASHRIAVASKLYDICFEQFGLPRVYQPQLNTALKLSNIGKTLEIYKSRQHAFYIAMQELNYGYSHNERVLIALLLRTSENASLKKALFLEYKELLPSKQIFKCLSFIYNMSILLHENSNDAEVVFAYDKKVLMIESNQSLYHAKESIAQMETPHEFDIHIKDMNAIPRYNF